MDFGLIWFLIAIFLIRQFFKVAKEKPEGVGAFQHSLNRIHSSWDFHTLKVVMYQEVGKHPEYEAYLSCAYDEQMQLLYDLSQGCSLAKAKIAKIISTKLAACRSHQAFEHLKKQFEWVLRVSPDLMRLFTNHNLQARKARKGNLFQKCRSLEEVKKRFRRLAFLNHPDRGGSSAAMSEINRQYDEILQNEDHFRRQ